MPRKKEEKTLVTYYIPAGSKEKIDRIVESTEFYSNKAVWKQKFYHLAEYISFQNLNNELNTENEFVNVHQETMAAILGTTNQQIATILKDAVKGGLFVKDWIWKAAIISRQGKQIKYIEEGKSFGYQFADWCELSEVKIIDNRHISEKIQNNTWDVTGKYSPDLNRYHEILKDIRIDIENIGCKVFEVLVNKQKKKIQKEIYKKFMLSIESNQNKNEIQCIIPFDGKFVPMAISKAVSPYLNAFQGGKSVPCQKCSFELLRFRKKKRKIKDVKEEKVQTTRARCKRAISIINKGNMLPNRPDGYSRVYCEITNLNREFRSSIRIEGKKIVGVDIGNSQPLIASILLRQYWLNKIGFLPEDVKQYQKDCEAGEFYQNFMLAVALPEELKPQFKEDFFRKVFFSKVIEKNNTLKEMFIAKYPSCWEAICDEKGGLYSPEYNEFAKKLQRVEASIMFDFVNVGLVKMGIKAFNIFDSIYVNNATDLETAIQLIKQGFNTAGVNPKINVEYKEHLAENERISDLEILCPQVITLITNHPIEKDKMQGNIDYKKHEEKMKKKYTVDELLSSKKKNEDTPNDEQPTKLQHLKNYEHKKKDDFETMIKGIQEQDAEDEAKMNRIPRTEEEINEYAIQALKEDKIPLSKINIDYMVKEIKSAVKELDNPAVVKKPYKFVNKYTS